MTLSLGIDPGWKNLGLAIVTGDGEDYRVKVSYSKVCNPSVWDPLESFVDEAILGPIFHLSNGLIDYETVVERYVAYENVRSAEAENINNLIGMIRIGVYGDKRGSAPTLYRAIEWKVKLSQLLCKHTGFQNPSLTLDKKFSIAAAKAVLKEPYEIKTDHEADAICLAAFPFVERFFSSKK